MARRTRKRGPRLALPWEREDSPFRSLVSGRRLRPAFLGVLLSLFLVGAHWLGGRRADERATRATLSEVASATRTFVADIGRCPHSARELVHPPRSGVHYLSEPPLDAWGRSIHLRCVVAPHSVEGMRARPDIEVVSAGQSGSFFDEDNIIM